VTPPPARVDSARDVWGRSTSWVSSRTTSEGLKETVLDLEVPSEVISDDRVFVADDDARAVHGDHPKLPAPLQQNQIVQKHSEVDSLPASAPHFRPCVCRWAAGAQRMDLQSITSPDQSVRNPSEPGVVPIPCDESSSRRWLSCKSNARSAKEYRISSILPCVLLARSIQ
jgi:hypothetical protein